jgi:hypothetical protein
MGQRVKYLVNSIPVIVNDNNPDAIIVTTKKQYLEILGLEGRGFKSTENKEIQLTCSRKDYPRKIMEFEQLLYEIENKLYKVEKAVKELKKEKQANDSANTSFKSKTKSKGNIGSNKSKDSGRD